MSEKTVVAPIIVDFSDWRMRDFIAFMDAAQTQNMDGMMSGMTKIVKSWPYDGAPSEKESYLDLTVEQWLEVQRAVTERMSKGFSQGN